MNRKLLAALIAAAVLVGGKPFPTFAQTAEPTPEVTPVVIESDPVVIPDDSTVIVVEAPETPEPAPVPTVNPDLQALLNTALGLALLFVLTLFGRQIITALRDNVPSFVFEPFLAAIDSVMQIMVANAARTPETTDDEQIAELSRKYEALKTELRNKTEPGK